jgi:PASTA domain
MVVRRSNDVAIVPAVVGLTVHDAIEYADWAGVGIGRDPDGPPLSELVYPGDEFVVTSQTPPPGTRLRRYETVSVEWSSVGGDGAGVREPRRPLPPTVRLAAARQLPQA